MLSRAAENLYWFGRYLQRAENTARLVNVHAYLSLDLPRRLPLSWISLVEILGAGSEYKRLYDSDSEADVSRFLLTDERFGGSLMQSVTHARELLRTSRDTMPSEAWEMLNALHALLVAREESVAYRRVRTETLDTVIDGCLKLVGLLVSNMSRGVGFQFLRLGMALEQADMTTRIIDVRSGGLVADHEHDELAPFRAIQWMSVLKSLAAYQMYRQQKRARVSGSGALRFLLQDHQFPRSVGFCLWSLGQTLPRLPRHDGASRALAEVADLVHGADVVALINDGDESSLPQLLDSIQIALGTVHNAITDTWFRVEQEANG